MKEIRIEKLTLLLQLLVTDVLDFSVSFDNQAAGEQFHVGRKCVDRFRDLETELLLENGNNKDGLAEETGDGEVKVQDILVNLDQDILDIFAVLKSFILNDLVTQLEFR